MPIRSHLWFHPHLAPAGLLLLAATHGCTATQQLPAGEGRGLVAFDPRPPDGAPTWTRPQWKAGDRYVFERGGAVRVGVEVLAAGAAGCTLTDSTSHTIQRRDADFGRLEEATSDGTVVRAFSPRDQRYHWPLWVGKRWRCSFVDRARGGDAVPLEVDYAVEAVETVTVPAGTFETLRIARTARIAETAGGDGFYARHSLAWYAPDLGFEVRHLTDGLLTELVEWTRGGLPTVTSREQRVP